MRLLYLFAVVFALAILCASPAEAVTAAGTVITDTATYTFSDATNTYSDTSNTVSFTVQNAPSLTVTPPSNENTAPGMSLTDTFILTNTGNNSGTFALTGNVTFGGSATGTTLQGYVYNGAATGTCSVATPCSTYTSLNALFGTVAANGTISVGVKYLTSASATATQTIQPSMTATVAYAAGTGTSQATSSSASNAAYTATVASDARLDLSLSSSQPSGGSAIPYTLKINNGGSFATTALTLNGALTGLPSTPGIFISDPIPTFGGSPLAISGVSTSTGNGYGGTVTVYYTTDSTGRTGWTTAPPTAGTAYFIGVYTSAMLASNGGGSSAWSGSTAPVVTAPQITLTFSLAQPSGYGSMTAGSVLNVADGVAGNNAATQAIVGPGSGNGTAYNAGNASTVIQGMIANTIGTSASSPGGSGYSGQTSNNAVDQCYVAGRASNVICQIAAGANAAIGTFSPDVYYSGGGPTGFGTTDGTSYVQNPAPTAVYGNERHGLATYTVPMPSSATYTVRLHFAENYWTSSGQRAFNVSVNGTQVLTNFDAVALVGAKQAYIFEYSTTPDANGNIVVALSNGSADSPSIQGLEFLTSPPAPTNLQVTSNGPGTLYTLTWNASSGATSYKLYRGTSSNGEGGTPYQTGISSATYADTVTAGSTYCYRVSAVNANGESAQSQEVCESSSGQVYPYYRINAGIASSVGSFAADAYYTGGTMHSNALTMDLSGASCGLAAQALYQSSRQGVFTYAFAVSPSTSYIVKFHFAEEYFTTTTQRVFNMWINSVKVLSNFDIIAAAGAAEKAVVREFIATSTSAGLLQIDSTNGTADQPLLNGLEILPKVQPSISLVLAVSPTGAQAPGTDLTYTQTFTNAASSSDALSFVVTHPTPTNADFKVGTASSSLASTFLSATVSYSNNGGSTYAYTPASGGGGAPAGYDGNVTNVKWTFTGTLCADSTHNSGSVSFTARIR